MRLGIFGGTFDPVHVGHLLLAERAREQLALLKVLWVPTGDPWRKEGRLIAPARQRVEMLSLAIERNSAFELCLVEVEKEGPSYSVETVAETKRRNPESEMFLLLGEDALIDLPNWHQPEELVQLTMLGVAGRGGGRLDVSQLEGLLAGLASRVVWVEMPRVDISGTEVRRLVAGEHSIRYMVPAAVEAYIRENGLYQAG